MLYSSGEDLVKELNNTDIMKKLLVLIALFLTELAMGQTRTQSFREEGRAYTYEELNDVQDPLALLVLFDGGAGIATNIVAETAIPDSAVQFRFKVIGIDQSDLFISDSNYSRIRTIIKHVQQKYGFSKNLFLGGFSLGGFTSIRFSEMAVQKKDTQMIPNAVFAVDPPLDHLDFLDYCLRELERSCLNENASTIGKAEANWVLSYYEQHFGPYSEDSSAYINNSCYTRLSTNGGNGIYLKDIPVNMIHEIDIMWLIKERCRDLSDVNAMIGSKFIRFLVGLGNEEAILTMTSNKGFRADGRRHPHSWSIAEPRPTLEWLLQYVND